MDRCTIGPGGGLARACGVNRGFQGGYGLRGPLGGARRGSSPFSSLKAGVRGGVGGIIAGMPCDCSRTACRPVWVLVLAALGPAAGLGGCQADARIEAKEAARPQPVVTRADPPAPATQDPVRPDPPARDPAARPVAGLVGQVAGQPVYAHRVLEGLEPQLISLAKQSPAIFRRQARELILARIQSLVQDRLYLDEAKGALTLNERANLDRFVSLQRQELVRRHGRGSAALADQTLRAATGRTMEQTLRDERDLLIVGTYRSRAIEPLVNVTRRDVERYYRDREAEFNPPDRRTVQSIYTTRKADMIEISRRLEAGEDFASVAQSELNQNPGGSATLTFAGDDGFGDAIAPTLAGLAEGQWAGPVHEPVRGRDYFIYLNKLEVGEGRSLEDAQLEIERLLRDQQRERLARRSFEKLRRNANVTQEQRMADAVLEIAESRFAVGG